jgi:ketosteroid isomerase-like protein
VSLRSSGSLSALAATTNVEKRAPMRFPETAREGSQGHQKALSRLDDANTDRYHKHELHEAAKGIEVVRKALDSFNRRDRAAWLRLCDPEIENILPRDWPESGSIRGAESVWDFYIEAQQVWGASSYEFVEVIDAGNDKVVAHQRGEMEGKASGAAVGFGYWPVFTVRNRRALRIEWFTEKAEALEAVGLRE